ncbi:uncharacterized protein N7484_010372 [Penicillium longicatenatum]|uniref:uncharacterized protein n=1 Tax=Penicillium longicatenatum TaxID=1561947 RepID=UPI0025465B97|nr:uncharacterized protein N7484_010372 [Penicillium longicatenatum]KAJ5630272.1 hypothetical protein N7484_010372 [Penicillium longicatenatum]
MLLESRCITILSGDLTANQMGFSNTVWQQLSQSVQIVIHAAASINLRSSLHKLSASIIAPSLSLAQNAIEFANLQSFVFVSTAYANSHLWKTTLLSDVPVDECIYPLQPDSKPFYIDHSVTWEKIGLQTANEWESVRTTGTSREFEDHDFPWAYAYAKHLTERLITDVFMRNGARKKLLIVRPSVLCPAMSHPHPGFSVPSSTPSTALATGIVLQIGRHIKLASRSSDPDKDVTIDEVPVDVVADRMLSHLSRGTFGCVHAVGGKTGRSRFCEWWPALMRERRLPWDVKPVWSTLDWHSPKIHPLGQLYVILGTSFDFQEGRTTQLLSNLSQHEKLHLKLFMDDFKPYEFVHRRYQIRQMALCIAKKKNWPPCLIKLLCRPGTVDGSNSLSQRSNIEFEYSNKFGAFPTDSKANGFVDES